MELTGYHFDQIPPMRPDLPPIIDHDDHALVRGEQPLQTLRTRAPTLIPTEDTFGEELAGRVDTGTDGVGVRTGSCGVNVELVERRHFGEEVLQAGSVWSL
jgi:hypothetical protein